MGASLSALSFQVQVQVQLYCFNPGGYKLCESKTHTIRKTKDNHQKEKNNNKINILK
jgi:hypothetical protein